MEDDETKARIQKAYADIAEVAQAIAEDQPDKQDNMTYVELADLLGVKRNQNNGIPGVELFNACLAIQDNPNFKALPRKERPRALRSAIYALDNLWAGRLS